MDIKNGDKVVALKHVIERAKGMKLDISGAGLVEQLKDVGMSTEQALVSFPNYRCWIYVHEISKEGGARISGLTDYHELTARETLDKIKEILEDSNMIKTNNKRYWEFWKLIEETEKDIASGLSKEIILYTIVADYGKPYDIKVSTEKQLKKELKHLKEIYEREEHPHFDILIYDENNKDVTSEVFKRYSIRYIS